MRRTSERDPFPLFFVKPLNFGYFIVSLLVNNQSLEQSLINFWRRCNPTIPLEFFSAEYH